MENPDQSLYFTPEQCFDLKALGFQQGVSKYLWHKDKHNKNRWGLYERNHYDISAFADKYGYNRWVSAVLLDDPRAKQIQEELEEK